jgi:hypothetical protein
MAKLKSDPRVVVSQARHAALAKEAKTSKKSIAEVAEAKFVKAK